MNSGCRVTLFLLSLHSSFTDLVRLEPLQSLISFCPNIFINIPLVFLLYFEQGTQLYERDTAQKLCLCLSLSNASLTALVGLFSNNQDV